MMNARYGLVLLAALAFSLVETGEAQAQCGIGGGGGYGYGGYGLDVGRLYSVLGQNVPHFAAFPPVYYSAPIPRTYGHSPFAYPPGTRTPELPEPMIVAKEILNPYVPASTVAEEADEIDRVTQVESRPVPLVVMNPYVVGSQVAESAGPLLQAVSVSR